jgi:hypothetical protein
VKFTGPGDGHVAPPDTARGRLSSAAAKAMAAARGRALRGLRSENWEEIRRLEQRTGGGEAKPREPTPRRSGGDDHHGTTPPPPRSILVVSAREYRTGRWLAFSSLASFSSPAQLLPTTTQHPHRTARRGPLIPRFFLPPSPQVLRAGPRLATVLRRLVRRSRLRACGGSDPVLLPPQPR